MYEDATGYEEKIPLGRRNTCSRIFSLHYVRNERRSVKCWQS